MKPIQYNLYIVLCLFLAGCVSHKINMMPDSKIPYKAGDKLMIKRLEAVKTGVANDLYEFSINVFEPHPGLKLEDESDVIFSLKQHGVELPTYDQFTKNQLEAIQNQTGLDFILVSKVESTRTIYNNHPRALLTFKLYDLKARTATVVLNIETSIAPLGYKDKQDEEYDINLSSSNTALRTAYEKGLKKFYKAFECCD